MYVKTFLSPLVKIDSRYKLITKKKIDVLLRHGVSHIILLHCASRFGSTKYIAHKCNEMDAF